jgi:hypothetical protein
MKAIHFLICAALATTMAHSAEILYSDYREDDSFKRISEHLSGKENKGRYQIFRTDSESRDGYYVALKLDRQDGGERVESIRIQYVESGTLEIEVRELAAEPIRKERILVGLTHGTWSTTNKTPTAWKLEFLDESGTALFAFQSFLWKTEPR